MKDNKYFLKVQYGPVSCKYYMGFDSLSYVSHLSDEALTITKQDDSGLNVLLNDEYLEEEKGCSKHDSRKNLWYVNSVTLSYPGIVDGKSLVSIDPIVVRYTGTAYLCNSEGKTVDILR